MTTVKAPTLLTAKRKEILEQYAQEISTDYFGEHELIKPEIIACDQGITYSLNNYNSDFKGLIHYKNRKFHVYLDTSLGSTLNSPVIRFTFAHELGHYFIDEQRAELLKLGVLPQTDTVILSTTLFEKEAEYFAACLLMPRNRIIKDITEQEFSTWLIHRICKTYKVSQTAAFSRYIVLGDVPIAMIFIFKDGKFDRKISSTKFRHYSLKLDENGYIPATSVAGRYCYEGKDDFKADNLLAADVWFNPKSEEDALRVYREDCMVQQNLNRIVSIVYEKKF